MNAALKEPTWISPETYLAQELAADTKHEYLDGYVYAMSGASKNHQSIAANVLANIHTHLKGTPCHPYGSDVKIKAGNYFFYPDAMVVCQDQTNNDYYTESPLLVVEVLSKPTCILDKTRKFKAYQSLSSVMEYVLIEQDIVDVEVCRRPSGWMPNHYFLGDEVHLESIDCHLPVAEIYRWVENEDMAAFLAQ